ncbi:UNVERIFIED_CONTAM: ATP-dependent 6-phosphofructokinase, chloroplastic [Sesamum radiatum]|uniref:ATP-dependent 6-phosphofructokinase, chloroplastic n=1 Tax=Sesamum radiatum TaxID=300843 RepID=A0AAW2JW99_SESRA
MENGVREAGGVCSTETGNGGEDVYSCKESDASSADHLVVMVHGILGSGSDWKFGAEQFVQRLPDKVFVHCSERNAAKLTLDGVDVMGERLAEEWEDSVDEKYPHVVYEERCKAYDNEQSEPPVEDDGLDELEEELVTGLSRVSWEKVDVSFHRSRVKFAAHSIIQVKDHYMHSEALINFTCSAGCWFLSLIKANAEDALITTFSRNGISIVSQSRTSAPPSLKLRVSSLPSTMETTLISASHSLSVSWNSVSPTSSNRSGCLPEKVDFAPKLFDQSPSLNRRRCQCEGEQNEDFVIEDVPHLTNFLPDLPSFPSPLKKSQAYAIVKRTFVSPEDMVAQKIVVQKDSPRGIHFRRAGPHEKVYIIGGDGTQKGAAAIYKEVERRGLKVAVAGIPKTIDNDIAVIDKSFGFDTAVEEAQRAINAAHVEVESVENGVGIVKLMGRYSGFIAMHATLASRDVDCCLIPESPFYLEGQGGLFEFVEERLKENGHMVIVLAEGAGQEYVAQSWHAAAEKDASGNRLLLDVGLWLTQKIKDHFTNVRKMAINMKYIDPTYMIRAIPSNASDNIYCTLLAQNAVHGAMAGYTGFTVGPVNSRHAYIPINRVTETQNTVKLTDRMWARLLASTNQPGFLSCEVVQERVNAEIFDEINSMKITSI